MATAVDLGDPVSPWGVIHPRNKETVGARLGAVVNAMTYGDDIQFTGPTFESYTVVMSNPEVYYPLLCVVR